MEFEEVDYWEELTEIMEWSKSHVTSTIHLLLGRAGGTVLPLRTEKTSAVKENVRSVLA